MYKKTTNKDRVLSQLDFVISEMKFAIETTKDVPDEDYFGTTAAGMILFRSSCMCIQNVSEGFRQIDSHTGDLFVRNCLSLVNLICKNCRDFASIPSCYTFAPLKVNNTTW